MAKGTFRTPVKEKQALCFSAEPHTYRVVTAREWRRCVGPITDQEIVEIFRPYYHSLKVIIPGTVLLELLKRDTRMASGWHVIWNLIEGCDEDDLVLPPSAVREGVDGDALAVEWLCLAYSDELLEIVHTAYVKARREGWGSHEAIIQLILHGYSNIAEVLPSTFNRKPQGREIGCFE